MIKNYSEFIAALQKAGFSGAIGGKDDGVFCLFNYGWGAEDESSLHWHTGDPDTDPWEWRMRVLEERGDIAYAKLFFRKSGYITAEWYPYFLAARRGNKTLDEQYADGVISHFAKRIYDTVSEHERRPLHEIKQLAGFSREDKNKFDGALTELQMRMYLTMCGRRQKVSEKGAEYGWSSTVFCTTESFFNTDIFKKAASVSPADAAEKITEQVLSLNPNAPKKKLVKFILG